MLGCNFSRLLSLWEESWAKDKPLVRRVFREPLASSFPPPPRDSGTWRLPGELGLQLQGAVLLGLTPFPTPPPSLSLPPAPHPRPSCSWDRAGSSLTPLQRACTTQNHMHASVKNTGVQKHRAALHFRTDSCSPRLGNVFPFVLVPFDTEYFLSFYLFFKFCLCSAACGILAPQPRIEPAPWQ